MMRQRQSGISQNRGSILKMINCNCYKLRKSTLIKAHPGKKQPIL